MPHYPVRLNYDLLVFQAILMLIVLSNVLRLRRAGRHPAPARYPRVSILVPARNEQAGIEPCVRSLLAQDYTDFELLVLDDGSTDQTRAILDVLARGNARLRVLDGRPLAAGWLGKNWACAQLAAQAAGELLYFADADTVHRPDALRRLVTALEGERADLLSGFPRQEVRTLGEKLIVPFFSWVMICFVPLTLAYRVRLPALAYAIGQMLLIRRSTYDAIGGHQAVRAEIAEDLALARLVNGLGYRWRMMQAAPLVSCRMYRSGRDAYFGLAKGLFAAFDFRLLPYLFAWGWLAVTFLKPLADLARYGLAGPPDTPLAAILGCIALALALWLIPYRLLRLPLWPAVLYPLSLIAMEAVAARSLWLSLVGGLHWKGRPLAGQRLRLW